MKKRLLFILFLAALSFPVAAQKRLVAATSENRLPPSAQFDSLLAEFGAGFDADSYAPVFKMAGKMGRDVRFVSLLYRTQDPSGKEVIASGLMAYPETGRVRGTIEVSPICKEKYLAGSVRRFTVECLPSMCGYAVLVPDTIGYGATEGEDTALLMSENVALVSAHFREAVQEYLATWDKPRTLPRKTIVFGYSLGAAGALETACYYHTHPEMGVKLRTLYLASGAYDPSVAIGSAVEKGESGYLVYPSIARSLNRWMGLEMDYKNLFQGRVLEDFDFISGGQANLTELTGVYGKDLRTYLHPDFFTPAQNADIRKLMEGLGSLKVPAGGFSLPKGLKIYLRHSAQDEYVPVACADELRAELRQAGFRNVTYFRDKKGTHYDEAALAFLNLFMLVF